MEDELGFTEGFDACWCSHILKHNSTTPTGSWQKG